MSHAIRRAYERLDIILDYDKAVSDIQRKKGKFIKKQTNRVTVWKLEQDGKEFYACYDKQRKTIATVLEEEPWD